jgi:hypothetical protein
VLSGRRLLLLLVGGVVDDVGWSHTMGVGREREDCCCCCVCWSSWLLLEVGTSRRELLLLLPAAGVLSVNYFIHSVTLKVT